MESNWVLPGRLLVGAYPASMNDSHHAHLLCTILLQGVSTFVCLQQEYRADGVTEEMWRSGEALRPYFQDVLQLLRKLQELKAADPRSVPAISAPQDTDFVHFPIVDCNVADDTKVQYSYSTVLSRTERSACGLQKRALFIWSSTSQSSFVIPPYYHKCCHMGTYCVWIGPSLYCCGFLLDPALVLALIVLVNCSGQEGHS